MKSFNSWESTHLKYHYFNTYIRNPLWMISSVYSLIQINILSYQDGVSAGLIAIDLIYAVVALITSVVCMIGFIKRNKYGWYAHMCRDVVLVIYHLILLVISIYWSYEIATTLGNFMGAGIFAVLEVLYYLRRKPLFFVENSVENIKTITDTQVIKMTTDTILQNSKLHNIIYCRKCGNKLLPDSDFCSYCGTKVIKEMQK